jgi:NADPH:quinone reductase-like Zn-dependent oxidoreductase
VIAGVRKNQLEDAQSLGAAGAVAIDEDEAIAKLGFVDVVADTVGGQTAAKLIVKVKRGGSFGYATGLPPGTAELNPTVKVTRVFAQPDPSKVREFADDVRDGKFILPIGKRLPLRDAAQAHELGAKGGVGKILLLPQAQQG